ncbi:MAG: hypothetical protein M1539_07075 [Actinobacteria bacterium]|nr:hypothetical protein [Actinomycetota bacterium]MCL5883714.1 hypothetical protein [Actinomycetota bacterium]
MQIKLDSICKEFDIRAEEIFAFMDEENIHLGGSLMHDIAIDLPDFRKFVEYWRRQLKLRIEQAQRELEQLDGKVDAFVRTSKGW